MYKEALLSYYLLRHRGMRYHSGGMYCTVLSRRVFTSRTLLIKVILSNLYLHIQVRNMDAKNICIVIQLAYLAEDPPPIRKFTRLERLMKWSESRKVGRWENLPPKPG